MISGTPSASANDQPMKTKATVLARFSGATTRPARLAACGVKNAAASSITMRIASNDQNVVTNADARCASAITSIDAASASRRSRLLVSHDISGDPTHSTAEPKAIR